MRDPSRPQVWGRLPDGSDDWGQIGTGSMGTPGAPNAGPVGPYVPRPANQTSALDAPAGESRLEGYERRREEAGEEDSEWKGMKVRL